MSNLIDFNIWRCSVKSKLEGKGYTVSFFDSPPSDNNSMRLDFKSNRLEASICAWDHGDVDFDAYDAEKDEFIFAEKVDNKMHSVQEVCSIYLEAIIGNLK